LTGFQFWIFRPDISFLPENERLKPEEIGYYTWDYVWLIPGKEAEFGPADGKTPSDGGTQFSVLTADLRN
jgi:hypothetical protein